MLIADMSLDLEPAWPWSLPTLGLPALIIAALLLAALTVWTYLGVKKATWRRVALVLLLRLSALLVAFSMMMRPSFAVTQLEGVELTKLLVIFDASESMNAAEIEGKPTRWEQANKLWGSREVQRRLEQLRSEQKIEVVKYLGAEALRPDEPLESANGKRTDIGNWLHELRQKHGHEKHLRGIMLVSDGADNGTRFSSQEEARHWRGLAPIHAFGVGDPNNPKYRKDIGLTSLRVEPTPVPVSSKMTVKAVAQAPGFKDTEVQVIVFANDVEIAKIPKFRIAQEKDQPIDVKCDAPKDAGEYKLTLKITPHPDEVNRTNNEISTFVQVIKPKINILWVDRQRVYEPTFAKRFALDPEQRFDVHLFMPSSTAKGDPLKVYEFSERHYDVIIIGDISAQQFSLGDAKIFDTIKDMVINEKTGLLMLGGTETFAKGGWDKHPALADLLPVKLDPGNAEFVKGEVLAVPDPDALKRNLPFLKLDAEAAKNDKLWKQIFDPLEGLAPLGTRRDGSTIFLKSKDNELVMAATRQGEGGHVVVFAGDSTSRAWFGSPEAVAGYKLFWKRLVFWLAKQEDQANRLVIDLDKRRLNANAAEVLGFTFSLRDKDGKVRTDATFKAEVVGPKQEKYPISHARDGQQERGTFQGAKEPGDHRLVVTPMVGGKEVGKPTKASFLVVLDDIEMLRPLAEHETLSKIAGNAEGRFQLLEENALLQYLDELQGQVNRESRHKTTHWPDWKRLPASDYARDQLAGLWHSFALVSFLLFSSLLGGEWLLRRLWGLV
jgi:hypothetical protein